MATPPLLRKIGRAERALTHQNTAKQIDEIRAKVDEIIQALANLNTNVTGSPSGTAPILPFGSPVGLTAASVLADGVSTDVPRADHVHSIASSAPSGGYGTTSAVGVAAGFMRSDARLVYPESLGTAADRTDVITLTDDATEGALLACSNAYAVNGAAIKAPNATNTLRVGKYGNISMTGNALSDVLLVNANKTDYNETSQTQALNFSIGNTNVGAGGIICTGFLGTASATGANAGGATTNLVRGGSISVIGGAASNNNFQGTIRGLQIQLSAVAQTIGTTVAAMQGIYITGSSIIRSAVTDVSNIRIDTTGLSVSGTITNHYGVQISAQTTGTNRKGVSITGTTTGTPTLAYGVEVTTHGVGTTRRGLISGNTNESTAGDWLSSTAAKGLVTKDTQGTARYWRFYNDSTGTGNATSTIDSLGVETITRAGGATGNVTCNYIDVGTSAPAT